MVNIIFVSCLFITVGLNAQEANSDKKSTIVPKIFEPGIISTGDYESHVQFSQDGKTVYYLKSTPSFSSWTIVESHHENGRWSEPEVSPFSGRYSDADPFITPDGKKFFFISNRPVDNKPKEDLDIWVMDKTADGWSDPRHLESPVNSDANEWFPTLTSEGTIYFGSERAGGKGGCDIYRATWKDGKYQTAENLGDSINTPFGEYEPLIAPDESYLIYESGKPGGFGSGDLYLSFNRNGRWTAGKNLGDKINSSGYELGAKISPDGKYFFWMSTRENSDVNASRRNYSKLIEGLHSPGNGLGDIYQVDVSALDIHEQKSKNKLMNQQVEEGFVTTDDSVRLFYQKIGKGSNTTIIPAGLFLFNDFKQLADDYTLIFYDMRNRGHSDSVSNIGKINIRNDVNDLEKVRQYFGVQKVNLIGYSYLGKMVALYSLEYPEHVNRIVQMGPISIGFGTKYPAALTANDERPVIDSIELGKLNKLKEEGFISIHPKEYCERDWLVNRFRLVGNPANVDKLGEGNCNMPNEWPIHLEKHVQALFTSIYYLDISKEKVHKLMRPVLIIHGTKDRNAPYGSGREWASILPDARLITVKDAAHNAWVEAPEIIFPAIRTFLNGEWPNAAEKISRSNE